MVNKLRADTREEHARDSPPSPPHLKGGNDADSKVTRPAQVAESFGEAEVKKAIQGFRIFTKNPTQWLQLSRSNSIVSSKPLLSSHDPEPLIIFDQYVNERNQAAHETKLLMAQLLTSFLLQEHPHVLSLWRTVRIC